MNTILKYREDWEEARSRLTKWWNGEDIGRPAMQGHCWQERASRND